MKLGKAIAIASIWIAVAIVALGAPAKVETVAVAGFFATIGIAVLS